MMPVKAEITLYRLKLVAVAGFLLVAAAISHAVINGDFNSEGKRLTLMPWGLLTLVDIYVGFVLFSSWVALREKTTTAAGLWIAAILLLGNIISCIYLFLAVTTCNGDIRQLLLGKYYRLVKV